MDADITEFEDVNPGRMYGTPRRKTLLDRWRREQAVHQYAVWLDRKCPVGSADGFKESPHRWGALHGDGNYQLWAQNEARKRGWGEVISQKKASIRKRWGLRSHWDIHPRKKWNSGIEYPDTYSGIF